MAGARGFIAGMGLTAVLLSTPMGKMSHNYATDLERYATKTPAIEERIKTLRKGGDFCYGAAGAAGTITGLYLLVTTYPRRKGMRNV